MRPPELHDVPVRGGTLRTARWPGGDTVILAAHGLTSSHRFWPVVAAELDGTVTLLAPDLRGRGASNRLPAPYGMDAHAADLAAVLDHFGCRRAVVAGHSMGGAAAVRFAVEHPDRVAALVLVDGGFPFRTGQERSGSEEELAALLGPTIARLGRTFETHCECRAFWHTHPAFAAGDVDPRVLDAYADYDVEGKPPRLTSRTSAQAAREDWRDMHLRGAGELGPQLRCPVSLVRARRGVQDEPAALYPEPAVAAIRAAVPALVDIAVEDTNHMTIGMGAEGARVVAWQLRIAAALEPEGA